MTDVKVRIGVEEIERVNEIKFWGVILDSKLGWKKYIDYVKSKISKSVAILNRIGNLLNKKALFMLFLSLFVPYLTYCLEIWGNTYKTYTQPVLFYKREPYVSSQDHNIGIMQTIYF